MYAGYGIDDEKYSNYTNLNVKGKIVVIKNGEPKDKNGNYIITGNKEVSKWSNGRQELSAKRNIAKDKGAKALFFMNDDLFNQDFPLPGYEGINTQNLEISNGTYTFWWKEGANNTNYVLNFRVE